MALAENGPIRPDFDQGVAAASLLEKAREGSQAEPEPLRQEGSLWVSFGASDLRHVNSRGFPLTAPVVSNERTVIFQINPERLPELAHFMHERFNRCGGFFAHDTRSEAEIDLDEPVTRTAGPYSLDQQSVVEPLVAQVREEELRGTINTMAAHHTRYYQTETGVAASRWLQGRWQALAKSIPNASAQLVTHPGWKQPSVVLSITGTESPNEIVVLGGHLDSISGMWGGGDKRAPGVDDNASGIAVLTEAVRLLGAAGWRPKKTVQFMGYAAEEVGLRGSKEIADRYAREGKKVAGVIQFDMTNFKGSSEQVYLLTDNVDPTLTAFLGKLVETYVRVPFSTTECGYGCSDHASWTRSGFAASAAFEASFNGMNRNIHSDRDTLANSGGNAEHSVNFAKLAVAFAVELGKTAAPAVSAGKVGR